MHKTTPANCRAFFDRIDTNKNGYITLDEWAIMCAQEGVKDPVASFLDKNGNEPDNDYQLTWEEYWAYCQEHYDLS